MGSDDRERLSASENARSAKLSWRPSRVAAVRSAPSVPGAAIRIRLGGHETVAVPLLHPSGQGRFMHRRGYRTLGDAVASEAALLRRAAG